MKWRAEHIRFNPLVSIAAAAAIVATLIAAGAFLGKLPSAHSARQQASSAQDSGAEIKRPSAVRDDDTVGTERQMADYRSTIHTSVGAQTLAGGCANCGVIQTVRAVPVSGQGSGLGAVAGGVGGAVVGSQLGRGNGRTTLGILGALGGAFAGNAIEKNLHGHTSYRVSVLMEDGTMRTIYSAAPPAFAVGETVRVVNGTLASANG